MIEIIAIIILICSLLGTGAIILKKIPFLIELPEALPEENESFGLKLKKKIKEFSPFKNFSYEIFLQKFISKIRILTLKTDNQTFSWLQKLRERSKRKTSSFSSSSSPSSSVSCQTQEIKNKKLDEDNYWEEIKKIKKEK